MAGLWNVTYPNRLEILALYSLEHRRVFCDLVLCYKIMNGLLDTEIAHVLTVADNSKTRGHSMKLTNITVLLMQPNTIFLIVLLTHGTLYLIT